MFPDSNDAPSEQTQLSRTTAISLAVSQEFLLPVRSVVLGQAIASRTTMPKTAIKKDGKPLGSKDKVRLPRQIKVSSPTGDSRVSENGKKGALCSCVAF